MSFQLDISGSEKQFSGRHPMLNFTLVQISFWVAAEVLLALIFHLMLSAFSQIFTMPDHKPIILKWIIFGIIPGVIYGIASWT